jgi:hypothetical protein
MSDTPSAGTASVLLRAGGVIIEATSYGFVDLTNPPEPPSSVVNSALASVSVSTLIDSFATGLDKTNKWQYSSVATVWDSATQSVKIPCTSSYWSLQTGANYDFTGSYVYGKVIPATGGTGTRETLLEILGIDLVNNKISFQLSGTTLLARKTTAGVNTSVFSTTYDPVNHLWLRLREAAGTTFYDTSPDGHTWTNFASTPNVAWDIAHIAVGFTSGYYGTEAAADTFIDSVNFPAVDVAGSAGGVATVTGGLVVARALRGVSEGPVTAVLLEPFDNLNAWVITAGAPVIIAGGRNGNGLRIQVTDSVDYTVPAPSESATIVVGFALFQTVNTAVSDFLWFRSDAGATNHIQLRVNADGGIWVLRGGSFLLTTAAAGAIVLGAWQYVEVRLVLHDTAGELTMRVNGTAVITATGVDTKNAGTKTTIDTLRLAGIGSVTTTTYDDLYVDTGPSSTFKGDLALPLLGITGTLTVARALAGSATGTSTATGALTTALSLAGGTTGTTTATGALTTALGLAGSTTGTSTVTGALARDVPLAATSANGTSTTTGALVTAVALAASTANGTSTTTGALVATAALLGGATGTSTTTGALARGVPLVGATAGVAATTGALVAAEALVGAIAGASTTTGALRTTVALAGAAVGASTTTAALTVTAPSAAMKVWNGTAFAVAPVKVWNGTAFVNALAVKTWNGSAFV